MRHITFAASFLRTLALLCCLALSMDTIYAQEGAKVGSSGVQVVHKDYTGFLSGDGTETTAGFQYLYDKLPPAVQSSFKAYTLGFYRPISTNDNHVETQIAQHQTAIAGSSDYYLSVIKVWDRTTQQLLETRIVQKLPGTLPAIEIYSGAELEDRFGALFDESFIEANKNLERIDWITGIALRKYTDFLFAEVGLVPFDNLIEAPGGNGAKGPESGPYSYITPDGALLVLPGEPCDGKKYTTCKSGLGATGILGSFRLNEVWHSGWYDPATRRFVGYAPVNNPGEEKPKPAAFLPIFFGDFDSLNAVRLYSILPLPKGNEFVSVDPESVIKKGHYGSSPSLYSNTKGLRRFIENAEVIHDNLEEVCSFPEGETPLTCFAGSPFPGTPFTSNFTDVKGPPALPLFDSNTPAEYVPGCNFLDMTADANGNNGRYDEFKDILKRDYAENKTDIIISDETTKNSAIQSLRTKLSNTQSLSRVVVWVNIKDGKASHTVVVPDQYKNKLDSKTINNIMGESDSRSDVNPDGTALAEGENDGQSYDKSPKGNQLLTCLGYSRLLISTAMEFLEGISLNDPKYWDSNSPNYFLNDAPYVGILKVTGFDRLIAMGCGAWTGIVDVLKDQVGNIESIQQILEFLFDEEKRNEMLGSVKEMYESLKDEEMRAFMLAGLVNQVSEGLDEIKNNPNRRWYYAGYFPSNIIFGVVSGSAGAKLKDLLTKTVGKSYKSMMGKSTKVFDAVGTTQYAGRYKAFLKRFSKIPDTDLQKIEGQDAWKLKHKGVEIGVVNQNGKVSGATLVETVDNNSNLEHLGTFDCVDANGNVTKADAYKKKDGEDETVIFAAYKEDDLIKRILKKYDIDINEQNIKKLREKFVKELGGEKAAEFLSNEMAEAFTVFTTQAAKMDFFEEIGDTFKSEKGVGNLFKKNGALSKELVHAWKALSPLKSSEKKAWVLKSEKLLERMAEKPHLNEKVAKFYKDSYQKPTDTGNPPFNHKGTDFDEYGFPRFEAEVPDMPGEGKIRYRPQDIQGQPALNGKSPDFTAANNWAQGEYGAKFRIGDSSGNGKNPYIYSPGHKDASTTDGFVKCVWHHHEDGKTLYPVPIGTHNKAFPNGSGHTGGATILEKPEYSDLIGFFPSAF